MWEKINQFLAPPVFEDEEKTRRAGLLHVISLAWLVLTVLAGIAGPFVLVRLLSIGILWGVVLVGLLVQILLRRGQVRNAGILLLVVSWMVTTFVAVMGGGIHSSTVYF